MIKGISGWESCNLWQSIMIWLWLLSGGAKGNHLLQHVSEIKGPADGFLTEREKCTDSSRSGWRCDDDAGVRMIKRTGCDKTVAVHEGMAVCVHVEGRLLAIWFMCVWVCVCCSSQITSTCCFIAIAGATTRTFSTHLCVTTWYCSWTPPDLFCTLRKC